MYLASEENQKIVDLINEKGALLGRVEDILDKIKLNDGSFAVIVSNVFPDERDEENLPVDAGQWGVIIVDWKINESGASSHVSAGDLLADRLLNGEFSVKDYPEVASK